MSEFQENNYLINKEISKDIEILLNSQSFSNGYIFYGPEGIGKKQAAIYFIEEIFKKYSSNLNIEEKIKANNHPDLLMIEPTCLIKGQLKTRKETESSSNTKETIRIDQIRNIKIFLSRKSIESEKKIVLIIDAHLLNEAASNCLLKTLEEPSNGIFILLTSSINILLDTITSRCQLIRFKSFSTKQFENLLKDRLDTSDFNLSEKLNLEDIVNAANGSPKKVLSNIRFLKELPKEIIDNLDYPLKDESEILKIAKLISEELEIDYQINLINFLQIKWWKKTKNANIIIILEKLKTYVKNLISPKTAWEIMLLKIYLEGSI